MSIELIRRITEVAERWGILNFKITGGEPLLRPDITRIVSIIAETHGIKDISLTTNGYRLAKLARPLKQAGLTRVNIGCDSLSGPQLPKNVDTISAGLAAATAAGLAPIKLNMVLLRGINDHEITQMIEFAQNNDCILQLIELIPIDYNFFKAHHVDMTPVEQWLKTKAKQVIIRTMQSRKQYILPKTIVEVVRSLHNPAFCRQCNKLRVTSDGKFKPCLMREDNLVTIDPNSIEANLAIALEHRAPYYLEEQTRLDK